MVRLDIHFRAELHWPGQIEMGLGVAKFGRTSVSRVEIVEGLNPGDIIIMSDMSQWDNVDRVRIK